MNHIYCKGQGKREESALESREFDLGVSMVGEMFFEVNSGVRDIEAAKSTGFTH